MYIRSSNRNRNIYLDNNIFLDNTLQGHGLLVIEALFANLEAIEPKPESLFFFFFFFHDFRAGKGGAVYSYYSTVFQSGNHYKYNHALFTGGAIATSGIVQSVIGIMCYLKSTPNAEIPNIKARG